MRLGEFKRLGEKYKLLGLSKEIKGDMETPISLFKKLRGQGKAFLFESVEGEDRRGRYSFIGRDPFMEVKAYDRRVHIYKDQKSSTREGDPLQIVQNIMEDYRAPYLEGLPDFIGGAVGYIGYDIGRNYKQASYRERDDLNMPDLHLLLIKEIIVYDHVKQNITIIVNTPTGEKVEENYKKAMGRIGEIEEEILAKKIIEEKSGYGKNNIKYRSNESKDSFMEKVKRAKTYIERGEVSQVVLSQRLELDMDLRPLEVYRNLRTINPSPYLFYIDFKDYQLIGSSPELMVKVKNRQLETCPIAGTRPRGKSLREDDQFARELLEDKKEVTEHLILLDLAREDLEKISKKETVRVADYMEICKCSHVMHIKSRLVGELKEDLNIYHALATCLPAGTLSGYPKTRAMEIIDELENKKRGIYGGAVGYFGFNGNMDTCITIRSILFKDKKAYLQAGAGIVEDSDPGKEYEETERKLEALMETIRRMVEG